MRIDAALATTSVSDPTENAEIKFREAEEAIDNLKEINHQTVYRGVKELKA